MEKTNITLRVSKELIDWFKEKKINISKAFEETMQDYRDIKLTELKT